MMTERELAEIERLWKGRKSERYIAGRLGVSWGVIHNIIFKNRDRFPKRRVSTPRDERERWTELLMSGEVTPEYVSEQTGVHIATSKKWLRIARRAAEGGMTDGSVCQHG
jgi:hypothetical protein